MISCLLLQVTKKVLLPCYLLISILAVMLLTVWLCSVLHSKCWMLLLIKSQPSSQWAYQQQGSRLPAAPGDDVIPALIFYGWIFFHSCFFETDTLLNSVSLFFFLSFCHFVNKMQSYSWWGDASINIELNKLFRSKGRYGHFKSCTCEGLM